jgi:hypothetical protein
MATIGGDSPHAHSVKLAPSAAHFWVPTTPFMHGQGLGAPTTQLTGAPVEPTCAGWSEPHAMAAEENAAIAKQRITARISKPSTREPRPTLVNCARAAQPDLNL